uniref:Uncharacterized protein n=1 Tax=Pipistrellus kuhlii TaxID=59472 RepID=A0A7J7QVI5_PIPKU|nr:hypothetical protein mPipKuh1_008341 [Pipistrellus kuhlii]
MNGLANYGTMLLFFLFLTQGYFSFFFFSLERERERERNMDARQTHLLVASKHTVCRAGKQNCAPDPESNPPQAAALSTEPHRPGLVNVSTREESACCPAREPRAMTDEDPLGCGVGEEARAPGWRDPRTVTVTVTEGRPR